MLRVKVGDVVYPAGVPDHSGRVIEVDHQHGSVYVERVDGVHVVAWLADIKDLRALITEERRRLECHEAILARIEAMPS